MFFAALGTTSPAALTNASLLADVAIVAIAAATIAAATIVATICIGEVQRHSRQ